MIVSLSSLTRDWQSVRSIQKPNCLQLLAVTERKAKFIFQVADKTAKHSIIHISKQQKMGKTNRQYSLTYLNSKAK